MYADELLRELRAQFNMAERTPSASYSTAYLERTARLALDLDRWVTLGNPPPLEWCVALTHARAVRAFEATQ
jgi:hypothetical protein